MIVSVPSSAFGLDPDTGGLEEVDPRLREALADRARGRRRDRRHVDGERSPAQVPATPSSPNRTSSTSGVGHHRDDRIGALCGAGRCDPRRTAVLGHETLRLALAAGPHRQLEARARQVGRHRPAHDAQSEERDALRLSMPSTSRCLDPRPVAGAQRAGRLAGQLLPVQRISSGLTGSPPPHLVVRGGAARSRASSACPRGPPARV